MASNSLGRDTWDWQFIRSEFTPLNEKYGPFDIELFRNSNNNLLEEGYDEIQNAFNQPWASKSNYGNPVYEARFIYRMFSKALADFDTDPTGTKFMFVLPKWESSNWWHFTKYFELIKEYPTGSKIFTAPKHGTYRTEELEEAGEEGGEDRVFIQGTKWPVCIFYKDVHTVTTITDNLLFHLRMGHPGKAVVEHVINHNIKTGLKLDKDSIEPAHCSACKIAKATKPVVYPTTLDHQYELFEFILSDIHGPVAPTSTEG